MKKSISIALMTIMAVTFSVAFAQEKPKGNAKKELITMESKSEQTERLFLNVKDFGAKGDGKTDDSAAIQNAFDAACMKGDRPGKNFCRRVVLPPGIYIIKNTIKLHPGHWNLIIEGTGGAQGGPHPSYAGVQRANTVLRWDGAESGILMDTYGIMGLQIKDIAFDGQNKCKVLLNVNSLDKDNRDQSLRKKYGSRGAGLWMLQRVSFSDAETGYLCGSDSWTCAADVTLIDLNFHNCKTGFASLMDQNLNYNFIRPDVSKCDIGLYFKRGGSVTTTMLTGYDCGYAVKIDNGGLNAGTFNFLGTRVETRIYKNKRTSILYAKGESNINFTSLVTTCMGLTKNSDKISVEYGKKPDLNTALFTIREGAMVKISSSLISGPIADMKGKCWLEMDNCRFRFLADPRKDIIHDDNAGFEISNSFLVQDKMENKKYKIDKRLFITKYRILPGFEILSNAK